MVSDFFFVRDVPISSNRMFSYGIYAKITVEEEEILIENKKEVDSVEVFPDVR